MSEGKRAIYKHAVLAQQNTAANIFSEPSSDVFHPVTTLKPLLINNKNKIFIGLLAVGLAHVGIWMVSQLWPDTEQQKSEQPVVVEIIKPEPEKPKIIEPKIPPIKQQPTLTPESIVEQQVTKPQTLLPAKPLVAHPQQARVLTAKADSAPTQNTVAVAEPVAPPPAKVVEQDLPVTEAKGYAGYLSNPAPEYPEVAFDRGWEGRVVLRILVSANGSPLEINVKQSSGKKILDDAAMRTVKRWKFSPAKRGSSAIEGWVDVPIDFKLP